MNNIEKDFDLVQTSVGVATQAFDKYGPWGAFEYVLLVGLVVLILFCVVYGFLHLKHKYGNGNGNGNEKNLIIFRLKEIEDSIKKLQSCVKNLREIIHDIQIVQNKMDVEISFMKEKK